VLEVGCGTGVLTRELALRPGVGAVVGVDAAPSLLDEAREQTAGLPDLSFRKADARTFDGDYATGTVALADPDSLQVCLDAIADTFVHDRWLARRLPAPVRGGGFEDARLRGPSFVETDEAGYMLWASSIGPSTPRALPGASVTTWRRR
jgi:SAM-dependent methyltransferase